MSSDINKAVKLLNQRRCTIGEIRSELSLSSNKEVKRLLGEVRNHYQLDFFKSDKTYCINTTSKERSHSIGLRRRGKIGVISDTHLCSYQCREDLLEETLHIFRKEAVDCVLHVGDLTDGFNVYPGQKNEIKVWGVDRQAKYFIEHYPKSGLDTFYITGNHDLKAFNENGIDIGNLIVGGVDVDGDFVEGRDDLHYLGRYFARVRLPDGLDIRLIHPKGSASYARSYKQQKRAESYRGGQKPAIDIQGHWHFPDYLFYRNIHMLSSPAHQDQTEFSMRLGLGDALGGIIIDYNIRDGGIDRFRPEFILYYD